MDSHASPDTRDSRGDDSHDPDDRRAQDASDGTGRSSTGGASNGRSSNGGAALSPLTRRGFVRTSAGVGASALALGGPGPAGAQSAGIDYNLAEALQQSLYFYDANQCGDDVGASSRLDWRGDCHDEHDTAVPLDQPPGESGTNLSQSFVDEHRDVLDPDGTGTADVSGGYHDAGDHVKFGMPEGYSASTVAWAVHEFEDAFRDVGSYDHVISHLRRFADYFVNCTFRDDAGDVVAFCHQVSKGGSEYDHNYWGPAELQTTDVSTRPAYFATPEEPASDECAAAAAGLAAIAEVLQGEDDDAASEYLDTAEALYEFALDNRGLGQYGAPHYDSSGDEDDLAWASLWLHLATGDDAYLEDCLGEDGSGTFSGHVSSFVDSKEDTGWRFTWVHSWDDVRGGLLVKLAEVTGDEFWRGLARWHLEFWSGGEVEHQDGSGNYVQTTPAGFSWRNRWGSARYNAAAQFTALAYHQHHDSETSAALAEWALGQMEYIMGSSPIGYSLIVGFTDDHAEHPHHDTAHGASTGDPTDPVEHRHTLWGALVGGPDSDDTHDDSTDNYTLNEVTIDFNAGLVGALAGHYTLFGGDGEPVSPFPPEQDHPNPYGVEAEISGDDGSRIDVSSYILGEFYYPARYEDGLSMRYFFQLGAGASPSDVEVDITYDQVGSEEGQSVEVVGPEPYDGEDDVYYVEFDYSGADVHGEYELSFALAAYGVDGFDPSTDPSYEGIPDSRGEAETLPLYDDGELVFGVEPDGTTPDPEPEPPASPADQWTNEVTETAIDMEWMAVDGAAHYNVTLDDTPEAEPTGTSYTIDGLQPDTTYTVGLQAENDAGTSPVETAEVTTLEGTTPTCEGAEGGSTTVDGQTVCDVNDDGYYRDVTGDGSVGQGDVAEFFTKQHRSAWKQPDMFDFSENGAVTHGDVVELFDYVALN